MKQRFSKGDLIEMDGMLGAVVEIEDGGDPEDLHLVVWFGEPPTQRISKGGTAGTPPIVWLVPAEYCLPAQPPTIKH